MYSETTLYHHAEARALTPVTYCKIKREHMWDLLDHQEVRKEVFNTIYQSVFLISRFTALPLKSDIRQRIIILLYTLMTGIGDRESDTSIAIHKISQETIASICNTTRPTVSKI
mgnify:CR=1 FL=1